MFGLTTFDRDYDLFDSMAKNFFGDTASSKGVCRTDIRDEGDKFVMEAELPGFDKGDIKLDIDGDILTLTAEHSTQNEEKDKNGKYIRRERSYGSYRRSFDISGVDAEKMSAEYKNGILILDLPKLGEQPKTTRRLEIK